MLTMRITGLTKNFQVHRPEFKLIFDKLGINWKIEYLPTLTSDGTKEE